MSQTFILHKDGTRDSVMDRLLKLLAGLSMTRTWTVEIKQFVKARTNPQNRYLNGVAYKIIGDAAGYDRDDVSEFLCGEHFGWKDKLKPGRRMERVPVRTTTTDENGMPCVLSTVEFEEYVEFVKRFAAKQGIHVPDPDPMWFLADAPP